MSPWQRFETEITPWEVEERTPARPPTLESDVLVPLAQALATGVLLGGATGLVGTWLQAPDPWALALGVGCGATVLTWGALLRQVRDLLWQVRTALAPGPTTEPERPTVRVELAHQGEKRLQYLNIPGDPDRLAHLARRVLAGDPLSEARWTGKRGPFSKAEFQALRAELLRAHLVRWRNPGAPAQGVELTPVGRAVFRRLAQGGEPPTPAGL
jgi:hypothetical protein